jgi:hypothetical protein
MLWASMDMKDLNFKAFGLVQYQDLNFKAFGLVQYLQFYQFNYIMYIHAHLFRFRTSCLFHYFLNEIGSYIFGMYLANEQCKALIHFFTYSIVTAFNRVVNVSHPFVNTKVGKFVFGTFDEPCMVWKIMGVPDIDDSHFIRLLRLHLIKAVIFSVIHT